ncbi:MAG: 4'-phosphopantetheinyl transferase superfamily protein [Methanobrevibacter sp.]|jgi:4'-phosphopantetheinyl transferase|nr:4'-phosphopantetheinyl transferase superfamily protein [Candidatus Methanovirga aequatorialis]
MMNLNYFNVSSLDMKVMSSYLTEDCLKSLKEKYLFNRDVLLSGGGRILLKYTLSKLGIDSYTITIDDNGKPYLENYPNIHFNISHSDKFVLVGVSDENIGLDIEKAQDLDYEGISKNFFHSIEHEYIIGSKNPIDTFFKIWTVKESYVKMKGAGIANLKSFIYTLERNIIQDTEENQIGDVKLKTWKLNNYYVSVCSKEDVTTEPEEILLSSINNQLK